MMALVAEPNRAKLSLIYVGLDYVPNSVGIGSRTTTLSNL